MLSDAELALLNKLAEKIGTTGDKVWDILIYQAKTSACIDLVQYWLIGLMWYGLYRAYMWGTKEEDGVSPGIEVIFVGALGIVTLLTFIVFFAVHDTATAFINPEYTALKSLSKLLK